MHQFKEHKRRKKETDSVDEVPDSPYTTINFAGEKFFVLNQGGILGRGSQAKAYRAYRVLPDNQIELVVLKSYYNNARANNELITLQRLNKRCGIGQVGKGENQETFVFEPLEDGKPVAVFFKEIASDILDESIDPHAKTERFVKAIAIFDSIINSLKALHDEGIIHRDAHFDNFIFDDSTNKITPIDFDKSELCEPLKLVRTYPQTNIINEYIDNKQVQALLEDYISVVADLHERKRGAGLLSDKILNQLPDNIALFAKNFRDDLVQFVLQLNQDKCDKFSDYQRVEKLMSLIEKFIENLKFCENINKLTPQEQEALSLSAANEELDFLDMLPPAPTHKGAGEPEHITLDNVSLNLSESQTRRSKA